MSPETVLRTAFWSLVFRWFPRLKCLSASIATTAIHSVSTGVDRNYAIHSVAIGVDRIAILE
jgi:hypothetical protein